jgi:tRNA-dihydrouridine synthase
MEGVTDFPARIWFFLVSAPEFVSTPFLRLCENFPKYEIPTEWCPEILVPELAEIIPYQCIPQFMSPEPEYFIASAKKILLQTPFVDLNCGCPAPKAVGKGAGSSLLVDIKRFQAFLTQVVGEIGTEQLSVKMRVGYHDSGNFAELLHTVAEVNIHRLSIHGRTRDQGYLGQANWKLIAQAAADLPLPVIGSGDIQDSASLDARMGLESKLGGAIVGRGALRNPWIFDEFRTKNRTVVDLEALPYALAAFAVLNHLFLTDFPMLCKSVQQILSVDHPEKMLERWQSIFSELVSVPFGRNLRLSEIDVNRRAIGRLKLLWGYMRTSLPAEFFNPPLMRAKTVPEFLAGLNVICQAYKEHNGVSWVQPHVNSAYDWMFSGERRT